jgi:hypothetical protein
MQSTEGRVMTDRLNFYKSNPKILLEHILNAPSAATVYFELLEKYLPQTVKL